MISSNRITNRPLQQVVVVASVALLLFVGYVSNEPYTCHAFTASTPLTTRSHVMIQTRNNHVISSSSSSSTQQQHAKSHSNVFALHATNYDKEDADDEIVRLRTMAAKLRAEAAALEAEKAKDLADAAERAFRKFDTNQDGVVSLEELRTGLEREFKTELSESRVQQLMIDFDKTGDGTSLRLNEFVSLERFRNKLDQLARDEKATAIAMVKQAKMEEEFASLLEARMNLLNDKPPSVTDKVLSILPYLFPLLDGLQYGRYFIIENPDNLFSIALALIYALYRSIPFSGFISFLALSVLSGNPSINRLIRFNMQQAIYLDIALFFPGLLGALYSLIGGAAGVQLPTEFTEIGSDVLFFTLVATIFYCIVSSILGQTPNKLPIISNAVENRMPSMDMFDEQGRFQPKNKEEKDKKD